MNATGIMTLTNAGMNIYSAAQTGATLTFTSVIVGDGEISSGTDITELTALISPVNVPVGIAGPVVTGGGQTRISATLSSGETAFVLREIGVYASVSNNSPVLYAYCNLGNSAIPVPASGSGWSLMQVLNIFTQTGNASSITATVTAAIGVTYGDFTSHTSAAVLAHPDGSVTTAKIAGSAVTTAKIDDGAVTAAKIAEAVWAIIENIGDKADLVAKNTLNSVYLTLWDERDELAECNDFDDYFIDYTDYTGGLDEYSVMVTDNGITLPMASPSPIFFKSYADISGDESEIYSVQALLYPDGTIYERYCVLWTLSGGTASDPEFSVWSSSPVYTTIAKFEEEENP